ncbi:MAG: amino acid permease [Acidipropionibacterium sp.]|nr:amino acid permease [Acidipropionibacterium sp.]
MDARAQSEAQSDLHRGLKSRHMNMIAIGGAIGTGLFVASGGTISQAGPGGALVAYALIGLMVYLLMQSLGEMSAYIPVPGAFETYATRFVSPSFGFAIGWNYWFNWAITVAAELAAAAIVMQYWLPGVPSWVWSVLFLALLVGLNALSARAYGEGEFWFATVKVAAVVIFLVLGVLMIIGILGGHSPGTSNWTRGDAPFVHGLGGVMSVFLIAGFSFQGEELIGIAAGEAKDPEKAIPRATRQIFWRIMIFYIGAITVIGFLLPYTDPNLLASDVSDVAISPFTLVLRRAGIAGAAAVMNAVILTSILSAGNSGLYASTRMLYAMAREHKAPGIFAMVNRRGVPVYALIATSLVGAACFATSLVGSGKAYTWLVDLSSLCGFIAWLGIAVCHLQFRRAFLAQGHLLSELPFRARWYPLGPILAFVLCIVVVVGQGWDAVIRGDIQGTVVAYIGVPVFLAIWAGHKVVTRSSKADLRTADLSRR